MTATYSQMPAMAFGGGQWERAVPVGSEVSDSDQGYAAVAPRYRSMKSQKTTDNHGNGYSSDRSSSRNGSDGRQRSLGSGTHETSLDDSAWIHRDKLAAIESTEMAHAGLRVRRPSSHSLRSRSRSAGRSSSQHSRRRSRNSDLQGRQSPAEDTNGTYYGYGSIDSPAVPPIPSGAEDFTGRGSGLVETSGFGYEEAEDVSQARARSMSRPGTSRIPISRNSPAPMSEALLDRTSPVPRSRQGSLALSSSPDMNIKNHKRRSQSMGSQMLMDEAAKPQNRTPRSRPASAHLSNSPFSPDSSDSYTSPNPTKPAGLNIKKATNHNRKSSTSKSRVVSTSSAKDSPSSARPKSSNRPRSVHRPEGEAPWIATMYKPDPMLPPDQQILPTHAKKLLQEQWEREGKIGNTYDRNFNLVNDSDPTGGKLPPAPMSATTTPTKAPPPQEEEETFPRPWVDPSKSRPTSQTASRAGSVGGYRITPTISNSSPVMTRDNAPHVAGTKHDRRQSMYRLQTVGQLPREAEVRDMTGQGVRAEVEEKIVVHRLDPEKMALSGKGEKEKKGCCCIVM